MFIASLHRLLVLPSPEQVPGSLRIPDHLRGNMHLRSSASILLLLLLCLLKVNAQEGGYLQRALVALDLPLETDPEPRLLKNNTGVLITKVLQAVHCAQRTGTSQDICDQVRPELFITKERTNLISPSAYIFTGFRLFILPLRFKYQQQNK